MGENLLKFWRWLQNVAQQAVIVEAPAIMTAAGQKINRNTRKVEYDHQNDKDVKQLRHNLAAIGEAGATAPGAAKAIETGYNVVRHPKETYRAARRLIKSTKSLLKPRNNSIVQDADVNKFKSELDWSPENWFGERVGGYDAEDIAALQSHIPEYLEIEQTAKQNGTWLKMPDGSIWTGDPRSWVQLMSKAGQKLSKERLFTGMDMVKARNSTYTGDVWADKERKVSSFWANEDGVYPGKVIELAPAKGDRFTIDAKAHFWSDLPRKHGDIELPISEGWTTTVSDGVVDYSKAHGYGTTGINNIIEGNGDLVSDVIIHKGTPRKSLIGNNGNFDFLNPNIYKAGVPFLLPLTNKNIYGK